MPKVHSRHGRELGKGTMPKERIRSTYPRDELVQTYSGKENLGPASKEKQDSRHSTKVKDRKKTARPQT